MTNNQVRAAIVGGIIVFVWSLFSWMVLPWHQNCFKKFQDESAVGHAIKNNAQGDGVYVLPNTFAYTDSTSQKTINKGMEMMENGPVMFGVVHPNGLGKMTLTPFVISLIIQVIGAFIITWMLLQTKGLAFKKKVEFVTLFGVAVAVLCELPAWNWWGFPAGIVIVNMLDFVIGWFLGGLGIAKMLELKK